MVISSTEPLASLGAEIVRLGLSVGKQEFEPQCVKREVIEPRQKNI